MKTYIISLLAASSLLAEVDFPIILVTRSTEAAVQHAQPSHAWVTIPDVRMTRASQVKAALLVCLARGVLQRGDQAPNAEIANVSRKTRDGMEIYEIEFREPGKNPKITVAWNGRLLDTPWAKSGPTTVEPREASSERPLGGATGTKLSALPEAAQKTIVSKSPNFPIAGISRLERDGRVIYEVEFSEPGTNSVLQVGQDGTLVQDLKKKEPPPVVNTPGP